ncbi:MAG: hypothetical protein JO240_17120 [Solirubrobacterales bacterium]|nr:hypothetical protein [Solirubrobacterales bacterium]
MTEQSTDWKSQFLDALVREGTVGVACATVGVSLRAAFEERERDPDFALSWRAAWAAVLSQAEDRLLQEAAKPGKDPRLKAMVLRAARYEHERARRSQRSSRSILRELLGEDTYTHPREREHA